MLCFWFLLPFKIHSLLLMTERHAKICHCIAMHFIRIDRNHRLSYLYNVHCVYNNTNNNLHPMMLSLVYASTARFILSTQKKKKKNSHTGIYIKSSSSQVCFLISRFDFRPFTKWFLYHNKMMETFFLNVCLLMHVYVISLGSVLLSVSVCLWNKWSEIITFDEISKMIFNLNNLHFRYHKKIPLDTHIHLTLSTFLKHISTKLFGANNFFHFTF